MKRLFLAALLFVVPIFSQNGIVDIPDTKFPTVRGLMNRNFSWLDANKADKNHNHDGRYAPLVHIHSNYLSTATNGSVSLGFVVLGPRTIAAGPNRLPTANSCSSCVTVAIDAASSTDATVGGGSIAVLVRSNGIIWSVIGNGSSSGGSTNTDLITEGSTNLFFRSDRVLTAMAGLYESPLAFSSPFQRSGNTISCPTCMTGAAVTSVFTRAGAVTAQNGDYNTDQVTEATKLYFTNQRAIDAVQTLLNAKLNVSFLDTDSALAANSDAKIASQKAVKSYVDAKTMRGLVFPFDGGGSALPADKPLYLRVPFACALSNWSIQSTTAETVTAKVWLLTGGSAVPTISNVISTSGISLSSGTFVYSETMTDFTTTVVPKDAQLAVTLTAVTASQFVNVTLGCKQ